MRCILIAAAASLLTTSSWAAPAVITENLTGTISGAQTVDTKGYFGVAGADLSGDTVAIYLQYVPKLLGPSQACRNNTCTYNESVNMSDTQGALLITITINGHRVVYSPTSQGAIFFAVKAPYQLTIDADAFSGFGVGLPGVQFAALFESAPKFGQLLSPENKPVLRDSSSDYLYFYDATDQTPVEKLTYKPANAAR